MNANFFPRLIHFLEILLHLGEIKTQNTPVPYTNVDRLYALLRLVSSRRLIPTLKRCQLDTLFFHLPAVRDDFRMTVVRFISAGIT
jgi:hypothetical protein